MDDRWRRSQTNTSLPSGAKAQPSTQDGGAPLPVAPAASAGAKETERIGAPRTEIGKDIGREKGEEVGPRVEGIEVGEIRVEEEVGLPEDLKKMGVEALVPPEARGDIQPQAEVIALATTEEEAMGGASQPVVSSLRWLYTLFDRLVRKVGGGFRYVFRTLGGKQIQG